MNVIDLPRARVRIYPEQRTIKEKIDLTWTRIVDLGIEKATEILNEVDNMEGLNAYTVVWRSYGQNKYRLNPSRGSKKSIPVMMYYIIALGRVRNSDSQLYRMYYKDHRLDNMKKINIEEVKIMNCVMEEFGLNKEDRAEL